MLFRSQKQVRRFKKIPIFQERCRRAGKLDLRETADSLRRELQRSNKLTGKGLNPFPTIHYSVLCSLIYSKTCLKRPLKNRQNNSLINRWLLSAGEKYCRMLHENSAILFRTLSNIGLENIFWGLLLNDRFRQVLLYMCTTVLR